VVRNPGSAALLLFLEGVTLDWEAGFISVCLSVVPTKAANATNGLAFRTFPYLCPKAMLKGRLLEDVPEEAFTPLASSALQRLAALTCMLAAKGATAVSRPAAIWLSAAAMSR
jgi:hypothetical protein